MNAFLVSDDSAYGDETLQMERVLHALQLSRLLWLAPVEGAQALRCVLTLPDGWICLRAHVARTNPRVLEIFDRLKADLSDAEGGQHVRCDELHHMLPNEALMAWAAFVVSNEAERLNLENHGLENPSGDLSMLEAIRTSAEATLPSVAAGSIGIEDVLTWQTSIGIKDPPATVLQHGDSLRKPVAVSCGSSHSQSLKNGSMATSMAANARDRISHDTSSQVVDAQLTATLPRLPAGTTEVVQGLWPRLLASAVEKLPVAVQIVDMQIPGLPIHCALARPSLMTPANPGP